VRAARKANDEHMGEEEHEGLADFRRFADLDLRHRIAVPFAAYEAQHADGIPIQDKDPQERVAALTGDVDRMIESSAGTNAENDHDPEGHPRLRTRAAGSPAGSSRAPCRPRASDRQPQRGHLRRRGNLVDVPQISDRGLRGAEDVPVIGLTCPAVVLGYTARGQLRLSMILRPAPG